MSKEVSALPAVDKSAIMRAIAAEEAQWTADLNARDVDALLSHYVLDATFALPGSKTSTGLETIRNIYEEALKDPNFDCTFEGDRIDIADSGELLYVRGRYVMKGTDPKTQQAAVLSRGSYINVWKKDVAGNWKTVEDFVAADAAPKSTARD